MTTDFYVIYGSNETLSKTKINKWIKENISYSYPYQRIRIYTICGDRISIKRTDLNLFGYNREYNWSGSDLEELEWVEESTLSTQ